MKLRIITLLLATSLLLGGCSANNVNSDEQKEVLSTESFETVTASDTVTSPTPEPSEISIIMVGDILLHTPVEEAALQEDGTYSFTCIFENMKEEIQAADVAIVNQEVIIGGKDLGISGYPAFNAPFEIGDALVDAGFDVVCQGTNHALDKGKNGILNCLDFWKERYPEIAVLGIHDSQEDQDQIYVYEQDGIRIAILNYTYGTNGIPLPEGMPYAVDLLDEEKVVQELKLAEEIADFTIVCPHWGTEYQLEQSDNQEKWVRLFVKYGADLVLGTHPHVIQPIEWVKDEETGNEMLVYYSLGNFVNWTSESGEGIANRMVGGMAKVDIAMKDGQAVILDYDIEPVVCHLSEGVNGVTVYKLYGYTEELARENHIIRQDANFSLEYCKKLCEQVWPDEMKEKSVVYTLMLNDEPINSNTVYTKAGDVVFSLKVEIGEDVSYKRVEGDFLSTNIHDAILDIDYPGEKDGRDGTVVSTYDYHMKQVPSGKVIHVTITEELQQRLGLESDVVEIHCK